ncbi:MAG: hypothetical protein ACFFD4_39845, partial [Candidatus Odinarchaeota archaeon]
MVPSRILNDLFNNRLSTAEGKEKISEYSSNLVRDRLREHSFFRQVIPPQNVTRTDCQRSVNHDTLSKIVDVEPKSRAMAITFRGQPTARFVRGPRAEVAFFTISSEKFEKTEQELLAYEEDITKIIEKNTVQDIQEVEDREATIHIEAAVQALQAEANSGSTSPQLDNSTINGGSPPVEFSVRKGEIARSLGAAITPDQTVHPLQKPDLVNLSSLLNGNLVRAERFLLCETDFDSLGQWTAEDMGDKLQSETTVDGYKYNTIIGKAYVRTIKTNILRPGNVYVFTSPEFLGKFFILNEVKFYIDKIANLITWQSWEDIAMAIINIGSVRKLELYSGDASDADTQSLKADYFVPVAEDALGAENNKVDKGWV